MEEQGRQSGGALVGYLVTTDRSRFDIDRIHELLRSSFYWAANIPRATVETSIENSLPFAVIGAEGLVGFARVITDFATFAYLSDVIIAPDLRGKGLGALLMDTIMNDPRLQNLRRWMLVTSDAHELYRKFGFCEVRKPERFMERVIVNAYGQIQGVVGEPCAGTPIAPAGSITKEAPTWKTHPDRAATITARS
ncbi:MAG TPA: GNAT family N-acetyltransferase, partial [Thermoanaerobaculia bacterium]|nr:GNAT family N-acetyltransferase [Thermoanaerobaculia bacterium]